MDKEGRTQFAIALLAFVSLHKNLYEKHALFREAVQTKLQEIYGKCDEKHRESFVKLAQIMKMKLDVSEPGKEI